MAEEIYRIEIPVVVEDRSEPGLSNADKKVSKFDRTVERTEKRLNRMNRTRWQLALHAVDYASRIINGIGALARRVASGSYRITIKVLDLVTRPFRAILHGMNSALGILGLGAGAAGTIVLPLKMVIQQQNIETAFEVLLGSVKAAKQRVAELVDFAGQTPFTRDDIFEASRILEVFTKGVLSKGEGLRMVGDIASATQNDLANTALWMGRLYDSLKAGRKVGEETSRLQEMGAIDGAARNRLEDLAEAPMDINKKWALAVKEFERYDGMMKKMSDNLANLLLGVKSSFMNNIVKRWGQGLSSTLMPLLKDFRTWRNENAEGIKKMGDQIEQFAAQFSRGVVDRIRDMMRNVKALLDDNSFRNADLFGKVRIAWDKLISEPFAAWWAGGGQAKIDSIAANIGNALGAGLNSVLMGLLGMSTGPDEIELNESPFVAAGASAGRSFLSAFLDAFDAGEIANKAMEAFVNLQPTWLGGETSSPTGQALALLMDAWLITKVGKILKGPATLARGLSKGAKTVTGWMRGGSAATVAETTAAAATRTTATAAETAKRAPWYRRWFGGWKGAGPATAADAIPTVTAGPAAHLPGSYRPAGKRFWDTIPLERTYSRNDVVRMANAGQLRRYNELEKAFGSSKTPKISWWKRLLGGADTTKQMANAAIQTGRFGQIASAASSSARLLGRAVIGLTGPLGAVMTAVSLAGAAWGWYKRHQEEARQKLIHMGDQLRMTAEETRQAFQKSRHAQELVDEYRQLDAVIRQNTDASRDLSVEKERLAMITAKLRDLYPELISAHDAENGKMIERLGTIEKEIELQDKLARMKLAHAIDEGKAKMPSLVEEIGNLEADFLKYEKQFELAQKVRQGLQEIELEWDSLPEYKRTDDNAEALIQRANKIGELIGETYDGNGMAGVSSTLAVYQKKAEKALEKYEAIGEELKAARQSVEEYYNAAKQLIELDFGGDVTQGAARLETMLQTLQALQQKKSPSAEQLAALKDILPILSNSSASAADKQRALQNAIDQLRSSLEPAIDRLRLLNQEVNALPPEKKVNVDVLYQQSGIEQPKFPPLMFDFFNDTIPKYANGGLMSHPHVGLVGEAGPEMIVPLSPGKRSRGLALWEQAGTMLGVRPYEFGGLVGGPQMSIRVPALNEATGSSLAAPSKNLGGVHLGGVTLNFTVDGSNDNILDSIRQHGEEIADYIGGIIVQKVEDVTQNSV